MTQSTSSPRKLAIFFLGILFLGGSILSGALAAPTAPISHPPTSSGSSSPGVQPSLANGQSSESELCECQVDPTNAGQLEHQHAKIVPRQDASNGLMFREGDPDKDENEDGVDDDRVQNLSKRWCCFGPPKERFSPAEVQGLKERFTKDSETLSYIHESSRQAARNQDRRKLNEFTDDLGSIYKRAKIIKAEWRRFGDPHDEVLQLVEFVAIQAMNGIQCFAEVKEEEDRRRKKMQSGKKSGPSKTNKFLS
ncbi:hypothetical protein EV361DRAFT_924963 [Lentinula raphanica]|uniref:Uncharacterized protein n=1 Tax=Lentinula raphanica TaxID=153919 RepID=A0AA38U2N9_9AGAR|nr:hypothetical protein F5878DRAFT_647879 [Lentinula raphanica]KAJ3968651.1 hypothetical protein EV361DRAFT_924963 [Lentinula raphanica]